MSDFVSDGQPFETPIGAATQDYANAPPTLGRAFRAMFESSSTTEMLDRAAQREQYDPDAQWKREVNPTYAKTGIAPPDTFISTPTLTAADANKRYAPPGTKITDQPIPEGIAQLIGKAKSEEIDRESILARFAQAHSWPTRFAMGTAAFILDPTNAATTFLPVVGEERVGAGLARVGLDTSNIVGRTAARTIAGGASGAIAQAPLSAVRYGLGREEASDYDLRSAFSDMAYSAAGGAIFHAGFGAGSDLVHGVAARAPNSAIASAIFGQESGFGRNTATSVTGAMGPMQIEPATFAQYAKPGEQIGNAKDNLAVGQRFIAHLSEKYDGDPARIAVAYFSGEGNVAPKGSATPWIKDKADPTGKTVSSYTNDILGRLKLPNAAASIAGADALTKGDAMRAAVSQIADGREVDVQPVLDEWRAASGSYAPGDEARTVMSLGAPPLHGSAEQLIGDISAGHVAPRADAIAERYDIPQADAAKMLNDLAMRPDSPIELAQGRYARDFADMRWRMKTEDRVESSMRAAADFGFRNFGLKRGDFPSDPAFVDEMYRLHDLSETSSPALEGPRDLAQSQMDLYRNGFSAGVPRDEFDALQEQIYSRAASTPAHAEVAQGGPATSPRDAQLATLENLHQAQLAKGVQFSPEEHAEFERTSGGLAAADLRESAYAQAAQCLTEAAV